MNQEIKESMESTAGKWIVEAGELKDMGRGDVVTLKACLSLSPAELRHFVEVARKILK